MNYSIPGYEGLYECNELGELFSLRQHKKMKYFISNSGYAMVNLFKDGGRKKFYIHRIIVLSIMGPYNLEVNHIDGNKLNNNIINLEVVSPSENIKHSYSLGLRLSKKGKDNVLSKCVGQYTLDGTFIKSFGSTVEAFRDTGVAYQTISQCARGYKNNKTGGGFIWKYITIESGQT